MNQDTLQLSPIFPSINGRKTIENYRGRLENMIETQQRGIKMKSLSPKPVLRPLLSPSHKMEKPKKELRVSQPISTERLAQDKFLEVMEEYGNLNLLLKEREPHQTLNSILGETPRKEAEKNPSHNRMASTETIFHKKELSDNLNSSRQMAQNSVPPSNFVFQKKKIALRDTNQLEHIYHYALDTGIASLPNNSLGLSGKKVPVREVMKQQVVRQTKRYLKDLKLSSIKTYRSSYKDERSPDKTIKTLESHRKRIISPDKGIEAFKAQVSISLRRIRHDDYNLKLNTKLLDGSCLDKSLQTLSMESPVGKAKGIF